jgi:DNA-binding response OmpR family regulator
MLIAEAPDTGAHSGDTSSLPVSEEPKRLKRPCILLAEDHTDSLATLSFMLTAKGFDVIPTASYADALEAGTDRDFDLLLADIDLSDGSGLDLVAQLRQSKSFPAVAVSGYQTEADVAAGIFSGFDAYVGKPYDPGHLMGLLWQLIRPTNSNEPTSRTV